MQRGKNSYCVSRISVTKAEEVQILWIYPGANTTAQDTTASLLDFLSSHV